jgi:hypothetical protein
METVELHDFVKVNYICLTNDGHKYSARDDDKVLEFGVVEDILLKPRYESVACMGINKKNNQNIA